MFLPCTFWLADNYVLQGRRDEGQRIFEELLSVANDGGLLAEEHSPHETRLRGTFWLADNYVLQGRRDEGQRIFEQLLSVANDVGLLAEEYSPHEKRLLG